MAIEYKLSYTAVEIDEKLGKVNELSENCQTLTDNIEIIGGEITELKNVVDTSNDEISALDSKITKLDDEKVPNTRTVNGKFLSEDITLSASDVNADEVGSANSALNSAKEYTDSIIADEVVARNSAIATVSSETTTKIDASLSSAKAHTDSEIAKEVTARDSAIATAKSSAISAASSDATTKANDALASAKTYADSVGATVKNDLLNGAGAAYDTLSELGALIDDNHDAIDALETIAASKANASDLTSHTGNTTVHITSTERTNWNDANSKKHTHSNKTVLDNTTASFTTEEKTKLSGIATGANAYSLPTASSSTLGGVKTTSTVTSTSGLTACPIISGVPYYKDTNTTYTLGSFGITATAAELNYMDGVTSNVQTQLNAIRNSANMTNPTMTIGTTAPSNSMGKDGDVYLQIIE